MRKAYHKEVRCIYCKGRAGIGGDESGPVRAIVTARGGGQGFKTVIPTPYDPSRGDSGVRGPR